MRGESMLAKYLNIIRPKVGFDKLVPREKRLVSAGIIFVVLFLLLQFVVTPYLDSRKKTQDAIVKRRGEISELRLMQQEYGALKNQAGGIKTMLQQRSPAYSLFTFLDRQAEKAGVKELVGYMKPSTIDSEGELQESLVEMKLQKIRLQALVSFLQLIESPENVVSVKRISIQESSKDDEVLDVIMQIMTYVDSERA